MWQYARSDRNRWLIIVPDQNLRYNTRLLRADMWRAQGLKTGVGVFC